MIRWLDGPLIRWSDDLHGEGRLARLHPPQRGVPHRGCEGSPSWGVWLVCILLSEGFLTGGVREALCGGVWLVCILLSEGSHSGCEGSPSWGRLMIRWSDGPMIRWSDGPMIR